MGTRVARPRTRVDMCKVNALFLGAFFLLARLRYPCGPSRGTAWASGFKVGNLWRTKSRDVRLAGIQFGVIWLVRLFGVQRHGRGQRWAWCHDLGVQCSSSL